MPGREEEPLFGISVTASLVDTTPRMLRAYEEADLITPHRTEGNTRLYSKKDIETLQVICFLHKEREVNLSGIKVIFEVVLFNNQDILESIAEIAPEMLERLKKI